MPARMIGTAKLFPPMVVTPVVVTLDYCLIATLKAAPEEVDAIFLHRSQFFWIAVRTIHLRIWN